MYITKKRRFAGNCEANKHEQLLHARSSILPERANRLDGVLDRSLSNDDHVKAVIIGFGQGEEFSEHTPSMAAILHCIQGVAPLTLGDDSVEAQPWQWVHMSTELKHSELLGSVWRTQASRFEICKASCGPL